jgi:hypothetical protein
MSLGLPAGGGTAIVAVTSTEPFMMGSRCGADLRETAMNLTVRKSTFFVEIPDVTAASDIQNLGACSKFPNLGYDDDVSV